MLYKCLAKGLVWVNILNPLDLDEIVISKYVTEEELQELIAKNIPFIY